MPPYPVVIASQVASAIDRAALMVTLPPYPIWHVPIPTLTTVVPIAFRHGKGFGTDNAAIDGDAAALSTVVDLTAVGGAKLNFFLHVFPPMAEALSCPLARILPPLMMIVPSLSRIPSLPALQRALLPMPAIP